MVNIVVTMLIVMQECRRERGSPPGIHGIYWFASLSMESEGAGGLLIWRYQRNWLSTFLKEM